MVRGFEGRGIRHYARAVVVVALAMMARRALDPYLQVPFVLAYVAAILVAGLSGLGPGLFASALGASWFSYEILRAGHPGEFRNLAAFELVSVLTVWLIASLREARRRAEDATATARDFEAASRLGEVRLRSILDNCPAAVYLKDLQGKYLFVNRTCEAMMDSSRSEILGKDDRELFPPEIAEQFQANDRLVLEAGEPVHREEVVPGREGPRTCLSIKFPLRDAAGATYATCGISTDITDLKRAEREAQRARDAAESASRAKDDFLAMLSHELRTPLTPVLLAASAMLEDGADLPAEFASTLEMIRRNVELESRLIDDLLDLMRFRRDKMRLERRATDAHDLIRQALEICRSDIDAAGLRLVEDFSAAEGFVEADATRLQQVIWNLVKNAVKFTPADGTISVRTRNEPDPGGGPPRLIVEVSDTGIGISTDLLPKIFEAFEQGNAAERPRFGGLGLGLAISRSVAEAHGGHLTADSPGRGLGASFTLELTTVPRPSATLEPGPAPAPLATGQGLRILLVEDNADTLDVMTRLLGRRGHDVVGAASLDSALRVAEAEHFDLVISDLGLPDGSGLDLMRRLVAFGGPSAGIALSGFGTEEDVRLSREAGFLEHLTKPVDFRQLEAILRRIAAELPEAPAPS